MPVTEELTKATLWQTLKESVSGCDVDYTTGSLNRAILLLAVPMMLELALESVFSVADVFWVSRLGADAVASVGLTESLLTVIFAVSSGLSVTATALIARRVGEGDRERAATDAGQALLIGLLVALAVSVPLYFLAPKLLLLMGATPPIMQVGKTYAHIALGSSGVILLLSLNNAIFRGAGDAAVAMRVLWAANAINLILDPLLIYGVGPLPKLGVAGPAVATLIGRGTIVCYQLYRLFSGSERIRLLLRHLRLNVRESLTFARVSAGGMIQFLLEQGSWLVLARIVSMFGASAVAGYTIAFRLSSFVLLPSIGLSNAAGTLVGQNMGAGQVDRARSSVWRTGLLNFAFLGSLSLAFVLIPKPLVMLFSHGDGLNETAVQSLRFFGAGNFLFAFAAVFLQAFNGAGDTRTPSLINLVGFWVVEIPLAWWLARRTGLHVEGVFIAVLVSQFVAVLLSGYLFLRGGWTKHTID